MKTRPFFFIPLLLLILFGLTPPALAQIQPEPPEWDFSGLRIEYQRVEVTIEDQVATTHIEQLFVNENDRMLEGTYLFPLPEGAAVSQLTMWVDGVPIEAKILEKEEARQIYDAIVRQLRDPALLEYVGTSAIQANVFPIPPRDERRIEIEYAQILPADAGLIHYVYPQSVDLYTNTPLDSQSIRVDIRSNEALRAIYSPSHAVAINRDGDFHAVVGYEDANIAPQSDFELFYTVSPEDIGLNLLSYRETGQDGFFLLLAAPSVEVAQVVAKDVILVMDTSGSMEGEKMRQAQDAALYVVEHLNSQDRFNIVAFSTGTRSYATQLAAASTPGNVSDFINSLEAVGGTNISQALLEAMAQADSDRPTTIIFLTDGLATEGVVDTGLLLDTVAQAAPGNVRLFAFGVGDDVDTTLLDSLTQNHRGTTTYVRPFQAIDEEVSSFYAKVDAPVLTDISIDFDGIIVEQMYPQTLPDLFVGSQLVLVGRYRDGGPATITLHGQINGRQQTFTYADNFFRTRSGEDFIPRLWATRAIGHLLTEIRLHGENPELVQSVVNLSIRYGIITPYTSYLIEEDDIFSQTAREEIAEGEMADEAAAPPSVSGFEAVEEAATEAEMAEAEAPLAVAPNTDRDAAGDLIEETVQIVGSKTFVLRNGIWIDTAYDSDAHPVEAVGFASDAYFDLVTAVPEIGQYFALGQHVLVVVDDVAYQTVEGAGDNNVTIPDQPVVVNETDPLPTAVPTAEPNTPDNDDPGNIIATGSREDRPESTTASSLQDMVWPWGILLLAVPLFLGIGVLIGRRTGKKKL